MGRAPSSFRPMKALVPMSTRASSTQTTGKLRMQGKEVFKHAVTNIAAAITASAEAAHIPLQDIDWFVPHQANQRILDGTAKKLGIDASKVISTVALHGNT